MNFLCLRTSQTAEISLWYTAGTTVDTALLKATDYLFAGRDNPDAPQIKFKKVKNSDKTICTNVDFYSGFVYRMLEIPTELYTALFAISRVSGWCAHLLEEIIAGGRIIRPAYKCVQERRKYVPISER